MTIGTLLLIIALIAIVCTALVRYLKPDLKSFIMSFMQNFTGILFLVSGYVKAVDPMGTGFKMEQYFAEFEATLQGTWLSFLAPVFPFFSEYAIVFAIAMIVLEMVIGVMLLIGYRPKLSAWAFFLLIILFTVLTGFTFLTGYVPTDVNFFSFADWQAYESTNMRVTDCGCFGDFIKLQPGTSFMKDILLLVPAFYFIFKYRDMHQFFTHKTRAWITWVSTIGLIVYCLMNFAWNLPHADFRPFRKGVNIAEQKQAEVEAESNVQILGWKLRNRNDNRIVELSNDVYMKDYASYPKQEWEVIEQVKSKPVIPRSKISDFTIEDSSGEDLTDQLLGSPEPVLMIVCYKLKGETSYAQFVQKDSVYRVDTIRPEGTNSMILQNILTDVVERPVTIEQYTWDSKYLKRFTEKLKPLIEDAESNGISAFGMVGGASHQMLEDFSAKASIDFPLYEADDILLKTIIRSNPGVVLLKQGKILGKWHIKRLPDFNDMHQNYLQ
jgi:uncharacterized membrane protein YphA (DoxX/SURF4 family)